MNIQKQIIKTFRPVYWKEANELNYWNNRKKAEGNFSNSHYEYFYTTHFGIDISYYDNKTILDIGCGPRGSLEWALKAKRRIGLDPLANAYIKLGASEHKMEYINSPSEKIPLNNASCDAVFSFNSLDHVTDIAQTIKEIKRIVKSNGIFLLLVEINHEPTSCEPHKLSTKQIIRFFSPEFSCEELKVYKPGQNGIYLSIKENNQFLNPLETEEVGYFSAKFVKQ